MPFDGPKIPSWSFTPAIEAFRHESYQYKNNATFRCSFRRARGRIPWMPFRLALLSPGRTVGLVAAAWLSLGLTALAQSYQQPENPVMPDPTAGLNDSDRAAANTVDNYASSFVGRVPGCYGMGVGHDAHGGSEIVIFVTKLTPTTKEQFPQTLNGIPVRIEQGGEEPRIGAEMR
jgi:hypothetical protein